MVTLDGTVPSFWEKSEAEKLASNTTGVITFLLERIVTPCKISGYEKTQ
jgi:hypothetical protein